MKRSLSGARRSTGNAAAIIAALACGDSNCLCSAAVNKGRGNVHCPAHEDPDPSFTVSEGDDGSTLFNCKGGCSQDDALTALKDRGLWRSEVRVNTGVPFADRHEVARYEYVDHDGKPLYAVVRFEPKDFRAQMADGSWSVPEEARVLYRLPEVVAGVATKQTVFVTEGEKDADALVSIGVIATTYPFGGGKWLDRYSVDLIGANVVVCQDRDALNPRTNQKAGEQASRIVAQALSVGARSVKILEFPGKGKDAADWVAAGGSLLALTVLVDDLPEWESGDKVIWTPRDLAREYREVTAKRVAGDEEFTGWPLGFKSLDRELRYTPGDLWLVAAGTGVGKSTFLQEMERRAKVPTIFFSVEMSRQQLMDRTIAANTGIDSWKIRRGVLSPADLAAVMAEVDDYEQREDHLLVDNAGLTTAALESILRVARIRFGVRIAYLDYIQRLADKGDTEYARVTAISNAVVRIARQTGVNIVAAAQVNRQSKSGQPPRKEDLRDSGYLEQDAAAILAIGREEGSSELKLIVRKSRLGLEGYTVDFVFDALHSRILESSEARVRDSLVAKD